MARWRKLLRRMLTDIDPRNYSYDDAASILRNLGFEEARNAGTSHRKWRKRVAGSTVVVGLIAGHGKQKPGYIRDMIAQLRSAELIPSDIEGDDASLDE
jgi:predicted RNA binding protein YcfA (HicA-like mRNA interferase family)